MNYDIIIIGAGPAGLSLARALADTDLQVLVIEKLPAENLSNPDEDGREIALTHYSAEQMQRLGAWSHLEKDDIALIKEARVSSGNSPYTLDFGLSDAPKKLALDTLGYLVPNHLIRKAFYDEVCHQANIKLLTEQTAARIRSGEHCGTVTLDDGAEYNAPLIVAADTRFSESRRQMGIGASITDFSRTAIVCRIKHEKPHHQTAFECFNYGRTLAILPMNGNCSSLVITQTADQAQDTLSMDEATFNLAAQQWLSNRLGSIDLIGTRHAYPLVAVHADHFVAKRFALIGDAAVGMHPVTAHGFNLGIKGAVTLADRITGAHQRGGDIGADTVLKSYENTHMRATRPIYHGTNGVVSLFTNDAPPARVLRALVLRAANNLKPLRQIVTQQLTESRR